MGTRSVYEFSCLCGRSYAKEEQCAFACACGRWLVLEWRKAVPSVVRGHSTEQSKVAQCKEEAESSTHDLSAYSMTA